MNYQLIDNQYPENLLTPIEKILTNRGLPLFEIPHYIHTTDKDILSPTLLKNIERGAKLLASAIGNNKKIFIQVDSDCDGYTSAALLVNYLYCLFPAFVERNIIFGFHPGKEHGLNLEIIPKDVGLVIAPDSSSSDYEEHKKLKEMGIEVLVLDHHPATEESEYACVINNQICDYPTKSLSGVGIVFKFCSYLDELLDVKYADSFLDLVALGMVADVMSLKDFETKHLINKGIQKISNPFIKKMVEIQSYSLGNEITPFGIAFYIAPQVNATIRMGEPQEKELLFYSMLNHKGHNLIDSTKRGCKGQTETIAAQACRNCTNIKNKQTKKRDAAIVYLEDIIKKENLLNNKFLIIKDQEGKVDRRITGLLANHFMGLYQKPTLLLHKTVYEKEDGEKISAWEGSGRGYDKSNFDNFQGFLNESQLILYGAGHENAFGIGVADDNINSLIEYSNEKLNNFDFSPSYKVDFIFSSENFKSETILEIANFKSLWGKEIEEPYIAIENIKIVPTNIVLMSPDKKPTLKISLSNGVDLIKFKSSKEEYENLKQSNNSCTFINVIGRCSKNEWKGRVDAQIYIEEYEIASGFKYYF